MTPPPNPDMPRPDSRTAAIVVLAGLAFLITALFAVGLVASL
jgi:hypothetical protein